MRFNTAIQTQYAIVQAALKKTITGEPGDETPGGALDALLIEDSASGLLLESENDILMETA